MEAWARGTRQFGTVAVACLVLGGVPSLATSAQGQSQVPYSGEVRAASLSTVIEIPPPSPAAARLSRIRPANPRLAALLAEGLARSTTFSRLVEALERSDLFVYLDTGSLSVPSQLQFAVATSAGRYVRITLNDGPQLEDHLVAWLGHELQHAVEVAGAPTVRTPATLKRFYASFAHRMSDEAWCTPGAQRVTGLVLAELSANR